MDGELAEFWGKFNRCFDLFLSGFSWWIFGISYVVLKGMWVAVQDCSGSMPYLHVAPLLSTTTSNLKIYPPVLKHNSQKSMEHPHMDGVSMWTSSINWGFYIFPCLITSVHPFIVKFRWKIRLFQTSANHGGFPNPWFDSHPSPRDACFWARPLLLAIMGEVYDVGPGERHGMAGPIYQWFPKKMRYITNWYGPKLMD